VPDALNNCTSTLAFDRAAPVSSTENEMVEDPLAVIGLGLTVAVDVKLEAAGITKSVTLCEGAVKLIALLLTATDQGW
jgi:hypothetical protein